MKTLTISDATSADAEAIAAIFAHYVLESTATFETVPPDEPEIARRIAAVTGDGYPFVVSRDEEDGQILGFAFGTRYAPRVGYRYAVETTIYVRPDCVRHGIGSALLDALIESCEARGLRQAFAIIAESEPASVILHARHGFRPVGTLEGAGWKHGKWLDVFIMQRALGAGKDTLPED
ncbi:GNAT family N-acetyltransferase [Novosphingobium sp. 9]|uniref:GNAT family N-acetyltransferase n=1 Tax=Novosphingobium sp. 9 TaxID=2025349 RepID=UPI0021B5B4B7|nr:GNAT family N-acetyltransferase [Novosphingobium sp. 9]